MLGGRGIRYIPAPVHPASRSPMQGQNCKQHGKPQGPSEGWSGG
ncbi:hypothetical protein PAMC26510_36835 [Caballeronia sordidicola]|uniref:Uncharacterized protein n=1 Tax=Caballeronia sordidicola TaxID=196367 RepID=A0A242M3N9_CABSO|nr:hypothetical protein PAMC26510_36835 [Caballeronia sordidicola]